jgi:hypothetical protein
LKLNFVGDLHLLPIFAVTPRPACETDREEQARALVESRILNPDLIEKANVESHSDFQASTT